MKDNRLKGVNAAKVYVEKNRFITLEDLILKANNGDVDTVERIIELCEGSIRNKISKIFLKNYSFEELLNIGREISLYSLENYNLDSEEDFISFVSFNLKKEFISFLDNNFIIYDYEDSKEKFDYHKESKSCNECLLEKMPLHLDKNLVKDFIHVFSKLPIAERDFLMYVYKKRGNFKKYYEIYNTGFTYRQLRSRKDRILKSLVEDINNVRS